MKITNLTISSLVFFFSVTSVAIAETTDEKIKKIDEKISIIKKETEKIQEEINKETKKRELLESKLPKLENDKNTTGKITGSDTLVIETKIPVYLAIEKVADKVQKEITKNLDPDLDFSLILYDSNSKEVFKLLNTQLEYKNYKDSVDKFEQDYKKLKLGRSEANNLAQGVEILFENLKIFRTDKEFKGSSISNIKTRAFIAKLSNKLRENNENVSIYSLDEYPFISGDATRKIIGELNLLKEYKKIADDESSSETNEKRKEELKKFSKEIKDFITGLTKIKDDKPPSLQSILEYATFNKMKDEEKVYFMSIEILEAGSTIRKTTNLFNSRLRFSGGVIINYIIYDYDKAKIVFSNLHNEYTGFKKIPTSK